MSTTPIQQQQLQQNGSNKTTINQKKELNQRVTSPPCKKKPLYSSDWFPLNSLSNDEEDDGLNQFRHASIPSKKSLESTLKETTQKLEASSMLYNFVDQALGDPFIFYHVLSYLPITSHYASSLDL